jgi:hypothetical protein
VGQRHREKRKVTKVLTRRFGLRETELGELTHHISKAEARRRFVEGSLARHELQFQLVEEMIRRATADIQAEEDARFFKMLEDWRPSSLWDHLAKQ